MGEPVKERVVAAFGAAAETYESRAAVQRSGATALANLLESRLGTLPVGPVLEVGCGTGLLSRHLVRLCLGRDLVLSDLSPDMVRSCRSEICGEAGPPLGVEWRVLDGEKMARSKTYALVASGFAVHWFTDLAAGIGRLVESLVPGGLLLFSYQAAASYPEWRDLCHRVGVPYTANDLPEADRLEKVLGQLPVRWDFSRETTVLHFASVRDFFADLRLSGTSTQTRGQRLRAGQMRRLLTECGGDEDMEVTVESHFFAVERRQDT
jgi:malonyl-CoA O-methyltransferase